MARYYIDTCVWRDFYEERVGPRGRPLGEYAAKLLIKLIKYHDEIIISDMVIDELKKEYEEEEINFILGVAFRLGRIIRIETTELQTIEATAISRVRKLPIADAIHAIIARDNCAVLVSQDNHFNQLKDIAECVKPEELINI